MNTISDRSQHLLKQLKFAPDRKQLNDNASEDKIAKLSFY